ncbi:DNA polymerase III subunit alpha [Plebeiibacterium sediminum]|uniref:DNA polymerase III subunit alpha n=1 Tax=Plebeiibacterium sediminum TaxID=2992112 RepID=A0AAE3M157_9BACT|nr:DNA polymerase III subunit alpha [Plebeiobacterium sediminum]MCW3784824.1 DNA polymerase III subunit alpha [Plebeiobacterium sediminum]
MFLVFDTETTGLPQKWNAPLTDTDNWPRMVQLAWQCHDIEGNFLFAKNHVITPDGYTIPEDVVAVHGITTEIAHEKGIPLKEALEDFMEDVKNSKFIIGHNVTFDINIVGCELIRCEMDEQALVKAPMLDTMTGSKEFCGLTRGGRLKNPTLTELHIKLFKVPFEEAHNAAADVESTTRCFLELIRVGGFPPNMLKMTEEEIQAFRLNNPSVIEPVGIEFESFKVEVFDDIPLEEEERIIKEAAKNAKTLPFVHLHVHTQYSILDGANKTGNIAAKAKEDGQPAVAITDHGSMFGVKEFHVACKKNEVKPIIGVEAYVAQRGHLRKDDKTDSSGHHLILLAKNYTGYQNLLKLTSIAHTDGFYYKPRIDKELLEKYNEGVIALSACLGGEVSQHIMQGNLDKAKETVSWYKDVFGEDYYLEMMRHINNDPVLRRDTWQNQAKVNRVLLKLSRELGVKVVATNDTHFTNEEDAEAHDMLVCLSTGRDYTDPTRMRYSKQEWFKTCEEMSKLFADIPEALESTIEIANKVEFFELDSDPIMPPFSIPEDFGTFEGYKAKFTEEDLINEFGEDRYNKLGGYDKVLQIKLEADYLEHLTYEGVKFRYPDNFTDDKKERIDFELQTIKTMGFPGYFLIVQDFINWAKDNGVLVGPGRGSAAGAAVAYCIKITDVDPIKYDLLFERFLNPDRISMPDVDIDFDDDGRQEVLDYVTHKYGHEKVAHICTFGTMATKSSIKDVARVLKLDLSEANRLAKMVPEAPKMNFKKAFKEVPELELEKNSPNPLIAQTMKFAEALEGAVRQTGVHACGVLIGKNPLDQHLPVMPTKGEELLTTQYDGRFVEDIGLLKMDFLGLKTLSIFKEVLSNIKLSKGIDVDLAKIPLNDETAFQLFGNGETTAVFQFESPGMKKHLRALQPNRFEDLVAMNALYRPGPMEYIPSFIERKHGREEIKYDHPMMEPYLKDTYGITVYQEQVMLQSRALGGFTRGDSDSLRKAMGKKIMAMMDKLKAKFIDGCLGSEEFVQACKDGKTTIAKPEDLIEKIWSDWEAFASYAFNKSHSVCYAYVAYQSGYLKAHYPAEFMAGVLSRNLSDITKITTFMEECKRMGMEVLGPDVNESYRKFTVNKKGEIRFGMAGVKGVGAGAVEEIIRIRDKDGPYKDIYDFVERVNLQTVNKKNLEALAAAGGFDGFHQLHRAQYFTSHPGEETTFIENLIRYGNLYQNDKANSANSLFGAVDAGAAITKPAPPNCEEFSILEKLNREKDLIGIYLSAHPLDVYKLEINHFCNTKIADLSDLEKMKGRDITIGGMVTASRSGTTKKGNPYGIMTLQDYSGSYEFAFFGRDYPEFARYLVEGYYIMARGKIQEKQWTKDGELEVKINKIEMLDGIRESKVSGINISVPLQSIDEELITELASLTEEDDGNVALRFSIYDKEDKHNKAQFLARSSKIKLTDEIVDYLDNHPEISFTLS